jgi:hypothetical protein
MPFRVRIITGRRVISWPFGILDIGIGGITLRAAPPVRLEPCFAPSNSIQRVIITHSWQFKRIEIIDDPGQFKEYFAYHTIMGYGLFRAALEHCGYVIDDRKPSSKVQWIFGSSRRTGSQ